MIGTNKVFGVPVIVLTELYTAMRTSIDENVDLAVLIARHDDGPVAYPRPFVVARIGHFCG